VDSPIKSWRDMQSLSLEKPKFHVPEIPGCVIRESRTNVSYLFNGSNQQVLPPDESAKDTSTDWRYGWQKALTKDFQSEKYILIFNIFHNCLNIFFHIH